jgi:hypothetical protein
VVDNWNHFDRKLASDASRIQRLSPRRRQGAGALEREEQNYELAIAVNMSVRVTLWWFACVRVNLVAKFHRLARIMQCGWYREVRVKDLDSHAVRTLLVSRALLVKIKRDLENQIRGLLKNLGLVIGRAKMNVFGRRAAAFVKNRPQLAAAIDPLLKARTTIEEQIEDLDRKVMRSHVIMLKHEDS